MTKVEEMFREFESCRDELVAFHQGIVRIPTVNTGVMPTGSETEACKFIQDKLSKDGIASEILESAPGRGNLVARLGESKSPSLLLMSHTDVVPIEDERVWEYPPFSGELANGYIWGRGSSDCKALTSAQVMTMIILKRLGADLRGSLILAAGADEETGGKYGFGYLAREHPDKIKAGYALNEGGGSAIRTKKGIAYSFSLGEKGRLEAKFAFKGKSCHAATPWRGDNVLYRAKELLSRVEQYRPEIVLTNPIFKHLDLLYGIKERPTKNNIEGIIRKVAKNSDREAVMLKAASRMTLTPTMIQAGIKSNSVPENCLLTCDIRTVPGQTEKYVQSQIGKVLKGIRNVKYTIDHTAVSNSSPFNTDFTKKVMLATRCATDIDDLQFVPSYTNGFTDSRFLRPLGMNVYGFAPENPYRKEREDGVHGKNEAVEVETLNVMTKTFLALSASVLG